MNVSSESTPDSSPGISRPSTPGTEKDALFDDPIAQPHVYTNDGTYVLVTGGLGFIGSHTVLELLKDGHNVIIVDDLSNSSADVFERIQKTAQQFYEVMEGKQQCPEIHFHDLDYRDRKGMCALLDSFPPRDTTSNADVDILDSEPAQKKSAVIGVIHFAAFKAVEESIRKPMRYYLNNISGLIDFLNLLDEYSIKTFIFSSSAAVYGSLADGSCLLREEHCVHENETFLDQMGTPTLSQPGYIGITSPYGRTKFFGEAILSDLAKSDPEWNIVALRYFNPIGCDAGGLLGEDPKGVPSNLLPVVVKVMTGQIPELSVYGDDWDTPDGTAVRDFIHVTDLARGHGKALVAAKHKLIPNGFRTFNLGAGRGNSVMEVVAAMAAVSRMDIPKRVVERRAGDVQSSVAAAERARSELGWCTERGLVDACRDTWNYLRLRGMV